jgi:Family of unknown function (DUF6134)
MRTCAFGLDLERRGVMRTAKCLMMPIKRAGAALVLIAILDIFIGPTGWAADSASASASASAVSTRTQQLRYRVRHSVFGNVGTYTNIVQTVGDMTTVRTSVHLLVTMLGVGLHREDAERTERWQGDRLMSFVGTTKKNDHTTEVKGEAIGTDFVIKSPLGTFTAPATVKPANPWSAKCLNSTTMMRVDTGTIEQVRVTGGSDTTVAIDGATIPARRYQIDGATRYKIWIDQHDTPVMFAVDDDGGEVTFTLEE